MDYVHELRALVGHRPLILVAAGALIFDRAGRILLHRRTDGGQWAIPGGAMNLGESLEETARREVREETGLELGALALVDVFSGAEFFHEYPNGDQAYFVMAIYETHDWRGTPVAERDEVLELAFFPLDALPPDLLPVARRVLDRYQHQAGASRHQCART